MAEKTNEKDAMSMKIFNLMPHLKRINNKSPITVLKIPILDRYIARHIIGTILVVSLALLSLDLFFTLVNELKLVGRGTYTMNSALVFLALSAPTRFYAMFPWAALLGTLISLGSLASNRELVVMRTASISVLRICYSVVKAAFILTIFIVIIGEGIAPFADRVAQHKKTMAISGGQSIETLYGLWIRQGQDFIHVRTLNSPTQLSGITRYQFDSERKLQEVTIAEHAVKEKDGWHLSNIKGTKFLDNKTETIHLKEQVLPTLLEPEVLETARMKHPERLPLPSLWRIIHHRTKNELNANTYALAFWTKIFQPFLIMLMVVLAVPFVFGPLRSVSMGFRIVAGIGVAYLFHTINAMFAPLAMVYQVPPLLAVLLPLMFFAGIGYVLLMRVK